MTLPETRTCTAALGLMLVTSTTLLGAYAFQYIGGYEPCALCYRQRIPYYVIVPLAALLMALCMQGGNGRLVRFGLVAGALVMLASAGLGFHHSGVEWGWWPGPDECAGGAGLSEGSVLPDLSKARVVSCTEAQWRMFGLSFAGWNGVISFVAAIISLWGARRPG